jgi:hypothetical protein
MDAVLCEEESTADTYSESKLAGQDSSDPRYQYGEIAILHRRRNLTAQYESI